MANHLNLGILLANIRGAVHNADRRKFGLDTALNSVSPRQNCEALKPEVDIILVQESWTADKLALPDAWATYGEISFF